MIKKIYLNSFCARCLTLLVLALLSTNLAWGADGDKTVTISYSDIPDGYTKDTGTSGYVKKQVVSTDDLTIYYAGINTKSSAGAADHAYGYAMFLKNCGYIYSGNCPTGYYPSKVTVTFGSNTGESGKAGISFGNSALSSRNSSVNGTVKKSGTCVLENNDPTKSFWNFSTTGANVQVANIEIVYSIAELPDVSTPTFSVPAGNYTEAQTVELSCATEGASIYYTTDGTEPSTESTPYESAITVDHSMTIKAIAIKGTEKSTVATATYKINVFTSLEDLVAAEIADGTTVKVSFENVMITDIYTNSSDKRVGIFLNVKAKNDKDIEIYFNNTAEGKTVPDAWIVGGKVSGTLTCPWTYYKNGDVWELCPDKDSEWTWGELTYTAPTTYNITIADGIQNGTVEADMEKAAAGVEVTLTVTPDEGYKLGILTVKDATEADVPVEDNKFTMPASDVNVSATFEAIPTHDAKFFVNGVQYGETQNVLEGGEVVFPEEDPAAIGTRTFVGWTASPMAEVSDEAPEFVESATMGTEDLNFYAVYATKIEGSQKSEELTNNEIKSLSSGKALAYATETTYKGTDLNYSIYAYTDNTNRPWIQLKKDKGVYVKITAPSSITKVDVTITSTTNSSGGVSDISKHTAYSGTVGMVATDCDFSTSSENVGKTSTITNNVASIPITGNANELYLKVSSGARIWGITTYYGTSTTYSDYCTTVPPRTYDVTISDAGYATLGLPYAVTIPENVSAYTATVSGSTVTMTKISGGVIPANCGVILYAETPDTYTFNTTADVKLAVDNKLVAVIGETYICAGDYGKDYYLGLQDNKAVFKKLALEGTIPAGKAYLKLDAEADAKLEVTFNDEPTGIESLTPALSEGKGVYNLNGMKVNEAYKGIVIMNGKKYINK